MKESKGQDDLRDGKFLSKKDFDLASELLRYHIKDVKLSRQVFVDYLYTILELTTRNSQMIDVLNAVGELLGAVKGTADINPDNLSPKLSRLGEAILSLKDLKPNPSEKELPKSV